MYDFVMFTYYVASTFNVASTYDVASTYNVASSHNAAIIYNFAGTYNIVMTSVPNRKVVCQPRQRWFGVKKVPFQFFKSASPNLSQN